MNSAGPTPCSGHVAAARQCPGAAGTCCERGARQLPEGDDVLVCLPKKLPTNTPPVRLRLLERDRLFAHPAAAAVWSNGLVPPPTPSLLQQLQRRHPAPG